MRKMHEYAHALTKSERVWVDATTASGQDTHLRQSYLYPSRAQSLWRRPGRKIDKSIMTEHGQVYARIAPCVRDATFWKRPRISREIECESPSLAHASQKVY